MGSETLEQQPFPLPENGNELPVEKPLIQYPLKITLPEHCMNPEEQDNSQLFHQLPEGQLPGGEVSGGQRENAPLPEPRYGYIDGSYNMTPEQMVNTLATYDKYAHVYEGKEWSPESIQTAYKVLFEGDNNLGEIINDLPENAWGLIGGGGTSKDGLVVLMLNSSLNLVISDQAEGMLAESLENMTWGHVEKLAQYLPDIKERMDNYIRDIRRTINNLTNPRFRKTVRSAVEETFKSLVSEDEMEAFRQHLENEAKKDILNQIRLIKADLNKIIVSPRDIEVIRGDVDKSVLSPESFMIILLIAVVQHLPKENVVPVLGQHIDFLMPNGKLQFNLRLDVAQSQLQPDETGLLPQGQVFYDNVLNPTNSIDPLAAPGSDEGFRYYNTYTTYEVDVLQQRLIRYCKLNQLYPQLSPVGLNALIDQDLGEEVEGRLAEMDPGIDIEIIDSGENYDYHFDTNKPPFLNVRITKRPVELTSERHAA